MPEAAVFTVLGSGFGIYGYLPALIELDLRVTLPLRYRPVLAARPELSGFIEKVIWSSDVEEALARSNGVVVALRPVDQSKWIPRLARMPNVRQIILEKPIAPDPESAALLLAMIDDAGKRYRVGYTFRFTPWAQRLREVLVGPLQGISLDWNFLAHHYRAGLTNWKRFDPEGGGALRFYGIHVIALLAELGYDDVSDSIKWGYLETETERWQATFIGPGLCPLTLKINSQAADMLFRLVAHRAGRPEQTIADLTDPFASGHLDVTPVQDSRVGVLQQLCRSLNDTDDNYAPRQQAILALWARAEQKSRRG